MITTKFKDEEVFRNRLKTLRKRKDVVIIKVCEYRKENNFIISHSQNNLRYSVITQRSNKIDLLEIGKQIDFTQFKDSEIDSSELDTYTRCGTGVIAVTEEGYWNWVAYNFDSSD